MISVTGTGAGNEFKRLRLQNEITEMTIARMPDGLIVIDKPAEMTSHDVVARLRRILKTKKIGHTGTLDPFATGVLVLMVGKATRLARFLNDSEKEYIATLRFGYETDTGDLTGERRPEEETGSGSGRHVAELTEEEIIDALQNFKGDIEQVPPMYSAKKIDGQRLYSLAREGKEVERSAVPVSIKEIETIGRLESGGVTRDVGLRVVCSAGTYIRKLAEDIGRRVGVGCHLSDLRRVRAGQFALDNAKTLEDLELEGADDVKLLPMSAAVSHLPGITVSVGELEDIRNGRPVRRSVSRAGDSDMTAMFAPDGSLAAIGRNDEAERVLRPKIVVV